MSAPPPPSAPSAPPPPPSAPEIAPEVPAGPPSPAEAEAAWRARLQYLLECAVGEETDDGDIHLGLCSYTEAIFMVEQRARALGGHEGRDFLAALKPALTRWVDRAMLLQSIVADEGIPPSTNALLVPVATQG